jgi:hypothetical protein
MGPEGAVETVITDWIVALEEGDHEKFQELVHSESPDGLSLLGGLMALGEPDITIEELNIQVAGSEARADSTIYVSLLDRDGGDETEEFYFNVSDGTITEQLVLRETSSGWRIWQHFFPERPEEDEIAITDSELSVEVSETVEVPDGPISFDDVEPGGDPEIPTREEVIGYNVDGTFEIENVGERRLIGLQLNISLYDGDGDKVMSFIEVDGKSEATIRIDRLEMGETRQFEFEKEVPGSPGRPEEVGIDIIF